MAAQTPHVAPQRCTCSGRTCSILRSAVFKPTQPSARIVFHLRPATTTVKAATDTPLVPALLPAPAASMSSRRITLLAGALALGDLTSSAHAALAPLSREADPATSPYIQDLLKKTEAMRETRYIQRLRDYDRRNFRDYFAFEAGSREAAKARGINEETYRAIQKWLKDNP